MMNEAVIICGKRIRVDPFRISGGVRTILDLCKVARIRIVDTGYAGGPLWIDRPISRDDEDALLQLFAEKTTL